MWWNKKTKHKANKASKTKCPSQFTAVQYAAYQEAYVQFAKYFGGKGKGSQRSVWLSTALLAWVNSQYLLVSLDLRQHL